MESKDESFIAKVLELVECMADGMTYKEDLEKVRVVIAEWIETAKLKNRPMPKSKGKLIYA